MEQITPEHMPQPCASAAPYGSDLRSIPSAQGREQFDLFIAHIPQRMQRLRARCAAELRIEESALDYSADSLLPLWQWALRSARVESAEERRFSAETQDMLRDIGTYFGECFLRASDALEWCPCARPEADTCTNQPLIRGFQMSRPGTLFCAPLHVANMLADRFFSHRESTQDLFDVFSAWHRYVPGR